MLNIIFLKLKGIILHGKELGKTLGVANNQYKSTVSLYCGVADKSVVEKSTIVAKDRALHQEYRGPTLLD